MTPPTPTSTLFPYTTLFRSVHIAKDGCLYKVSLVQTVRRIRTAGHQGGAFGNTEPDVIHHPVPLLRGGQGDRKSTRLNSSHVRISYAVFCWKKKKHHNSQSD